LSYHKDRRYHKARLRRIMAKRKAIEQWMRRAMAWQVAGVGLAQINLIKQTPGNKIDKTLAIASTAIAAHKGVALALSAPFNELCSGGAGARSSRLLVMGKKE
jgi:L-asparaginase II